MEREYRVGQLTPRKLAAAGVMVLSLGLGEAALAADTQYPENNRGFQPTTTEVSSVQNLTPKGKGHTIWYHLLQGTLLVGAGGIVLRAAMAQNRGLEERTEERKRRRRESLRQYCQRNRYKTEKLY